MAWYRTLTLGLSAAFYRLSYTTVGSTADKTIWITLVWAVNCCCDLFLLGTKIMASRIEDTADN